MTSSNLQEHLADENAHVQYIREDVLQAIGDIIYAGVDGEPTRLPVVPVGGFILMVSLDTPFKPVWQSQAFLDAHIRGLNSELFYRQFVYEVSGGDFTFVQDGSGNPVTTLVPLEAGY